MSKKVVIVDYQLGNLFSVKHALLNIGVETIISLDPNDILDADALVLPGVGAFKDAMDNLNRLGLTEVLIQFVNSGKPFLGICLGLQLLFSDSEEFGSSNGLNIIPGKVKRFINIDNQGQFVKVPQIAWNTINKPSIDMWPKSPLFDINDGEDMYFVHSYYVEPIDRSTILTITNYAGITYASSIIKNNIFACQFHPEKSASEGLKIYKNWATLNKLI
jgi:glutamine amidotransferase